MKNNVYLKEYLQQLIKESMENYVSKHLKEEDEKTNKDDTEALKNNKITLEKIVEKINSIRSGKSSKDSVVSKNLEEYFNSLDDDEKSAFFVFLKALAQIFGAEIDAEDVIDPSDNPPSLEIQRTSGEKKEKKSGSSDSADKKSVNVLQEPKKSQAPESASSTKTRPILVKKSK